MEIRCQCEACQAQFKIEAKYAGRKGKCPKCGAVMTVPEAPGGDSAIVAAAAKPAPPRAKSPPPKAAPAAKASGSGSFPSVDTPSSGAIGIQTDQSTTSVAARAHGGAQRGRRKQQGSPALIIALVGAAALVLIAALVGVLFYVGGFGGTEPVLIVQWDESDRDGSAAIEINGQRRGVPSSGVVRFELQADDYTVVCLRRGYERSEHNVELIPGQEKTITPEWRRSLDSLVQGDGGGDDLPGVGPDGDDPGTDWEIGTEVPDTVPVGYEGWTQSLQKAQDKARAANKNLMLLFTGSDWCPPCKRLKDTVLTTDEFKQYADAHFVRVVLDYPRTSEGYNRVLDTGQNKHLQEKYGITGYPTMLLTDVSGQPYAATGYGGENTSKFVDKLKELEGVPAERDRLFAAAEQGSGSEQLDAVVEAIEYLQEQQLLRYYGVKMRKFLRVAKQLDPENEQGKYEVVFEADWMGRLYEAREDVGLQDKLVGELEAWIDDYKFQDDNRGARLHMTAAMLMGRRDNEELATKHIEAALAYEPTDKKLADALKQAKRMFSGELSHGTGWIAAADGYVMTNNHVIEGDGKPYVVLADGETEVRAKIIARDPERDMAILKIDVPDGLSWDPRPISSKLPRAASEVCVLGFPLNAEDLKFARGAVAGLPDSSNDEMIELDCRVNPGNSGGPMCDPAGNVLGMVTAKTVRVDPTIDTIGMAIPTSYLLAFLKEHVPDFEPAELAELPPSPDWADMYENAKPTVMKIVMKRV